MAGDPLITNATILVTRDGVQVGPASIPAFIDDPAPQRFDERGGVRQRGVYVNIATDVQDDDDVTLLTFNTRPARNPGPYTVEDAVEEGGLGLELLCLQLTGFRI